MVHREFAQSVQQDCFLLESCSPSVRVMAKQRRSAVPAGLAMCAPHPKRQVSAAGMSLTRLQASWPATRRRLLLANSPETQRVLFPGNWRMKVMLQVK